VSNIIHVDASSSEDLDKVIGDWAGKNLEIYPIYGKILFIIFSN
jgi:hypothetical protein